MASLKTLRKLNSVNGNKTERGRRVSDVEQPRVDRDAANKKWVTDNFVGV